MHNIAEAQQTIVQPTEGTMAGAAFAQPVAEMPQTGGSGDFPAVMEVTPPFPNVSRGGSRSY
jgi:hypothetical protein